MCQNETVFPVGLVFYQKCCGKETETVDYFAVVIYSLCSPAAQNRMHEDGLWRVNAGTGSREKSD